MLNLQYRIEPKKVQFIYSEKAKKFYDIFTLLLSYQKKGEDFAKLGGLLRIYEL